MTPTWHNCILTTGESPLTGQSAGAGAVNRVIDIECGLRGGYHRWHTNIKFPEAELRLCWARVRRKTV